MPKKHSRNTCKILFLLRKVRITESHLGSTKAEIKTLSVKPFFLGDNCEDIGKGKF